MPKTIIHVNQHVIKRNGKTGDRDPTLTVKQGRKNTYAHEVVINGPSRVVYSPDKPDRKSTRLNSSHVSESRMPSSA